MAAPVNTLAHSLNPIGGYSTDFDNLECVAKLADAVEDTVGLEGRVVHLNASGEFEMGVPTTVPGDGKVPLAMFLFRSATDLDVQNDGGVHGELSDVAYGWAAEVPTGDIVGLVASGAYELETTEYNTGLTYEPGDALTAVASNTVEATGGVLTKGNPYSVPIIGSVSAAPSANGHTGVNTLRFWPIPTIVPTS